MKTKLLAALGVAGGVCALCFAQDMSSQKGGPFAGVQDDDMDLLQPAMTLLAELSPQKRPGPGFDAVEDFGANDAELAGLPPPPDMDSAELVAGMPQDEGQGFYGSNRRGFDMMGRHGFNRGQSPQDGACPMMQCPMGGQRGFGMMGMGPGQGRRGGPGMKGGMDKGSLDSALAIDDPAKFEELKKLREQQESIIKDYAEKRKAQREEFKKLLDDYKSKPSDETKAKLREKIAEKVDAQFKAREARLEKAKESLAKAKEGRDAKIDEMLSKIAAGGKGPAKPQ